MPENNPMGLVRQIFVLGCALVLGLWSTRAISAPSANAPPQSSVLPGLALAGYAASIGDPIPIENLTVFPIYANSNPALANAISLQTALDRGKAKVREQGAKGDNEAGAAVGTLVVDNLGDEPIIALAGTVVRGGNQDRQIAQDFVIKGHATVPVDAFCVEHGRWSGVRDGKNTGGSFTSTGMLAPADVRVAGQHENDQSKVWSKVAETNARATKSSPSGSLMATYDAADLAGQRTKIAGAAAILLNAKPETHRVLGIAYAVNGQVRGARWFASRELFEQHRDVLLQTAAMEALTSGTSGPAGGDRPAVTATEVRSFIEAVATSEVKARKATNAENANVYKESRDAYGAEARIESLAQPVTVDISVK